MAIINQKRKDTQMKAIVYHKYSSPDVVFKGENILFGMMHEGNKG